jgi:hypothetical protein
MDALECIELMSFYDVDEEATSQILDHIYAEDLPLDQLLEFKYSMKRNGVESVVGSNPMFESLIQ